MKKTYIEVLRLTAAMAVVMIHITMTEVVNSTIEQIGRIDYSIYSAGYALSRWAVPIFIMITGCLLLNPKKEISEKKIVKYICRMLKVLFIFGSIFAAMEIVFSDGLSEWYLLIPKCILRVIQNQSWDHLWYIYLLIGLYILTPFTKAAIKSLNEDSLFALIVVLYFLNYIRPAANVIFGIEISNLWIAANGYYTYYLMGYYLSIDTNRIVRHKKILYCLALISMTFMLGFDSWLIISKGVYSEWIREANPLVPLIAVSIFVFVKDRVNDDVVLPPICKSIVRCSFGIYLLHPVFINFIYKVAGITPRSMPIILGIVILYFCVLLLSWVSTIILKKLPVLRNLL